MEKKKFEGDRGLFASEWIYALGQFHRSHPLDVFT